MSEFYDSLEDESDDFKGSLDSLQKIKINTLPRTGEYKSSERDDCHKSFYLKDPAVGCSCNSDYKKVTRVDLNHNGRNSEQICLPKIENKKLKGVQNMPLNVVVDNETLNKQGLQLNTDGGFTKSPRSEFEKLPFVCREYQNLQFSKRTVQNVKKRAPPPKINRKNTFTFREKPENEISMIELINARKKKGSSEEILTSGSSKESNSKFVESDNLTDSMKEMILKKQYTSNPNAARGYDKVKKVKRVMNLLDNPRSNSKTEGTCLSHSCGRKNNVESEPKARSQVQINGSGRKVQNFPSKIAKHQSDIVVSSVKPRLTYSERYQLKNGFNPLCLRYGINKTPSDTNRSNFGDSTADKLSEVSSRLLSSRGLPDEDEEAFYRSIIEKEKRELLKARQGVELGNPCESKKQNGLTELMSCGNNIQLTSSTRHKPSSKATFIDLPNEKKCSLQLKKRSHYCSADSSSSISKTELAIKAKTYGYLANARNIFKLKTQSEAKITTCSFSLKNEKEKTSYGLALNSSLGKPISRNLSSRNASRKESSEAVLNFPRTSRSLCKTEQTTKQPAPVLPQVHGQDNVKFGSEILRRINSCLNGSSFRVEDILYHGLKREV